MHAKFHGVATDAIDAEGEVEQRAERGKRPDGTDPDGGGAVVTLVQEGVAGGEEAGEHIKADDEVRPELDEAVEPVHRGKVSRKNLTAQARGFFGARPAGIVV